MTLTEAEKKNPAWWCHHHKQSVSYLVIRINQLLNESPDARQQVENMLRATLPAFAESIQHKLVDFGEDEDEVGIS